MSNTVWCRLTVNDVAAHDTVRAWFGQQNIEYQRRPDSNTFTWQSRGMPSFECVGFLSMQGIYATLEVEDILANLMLTLTASPSPQHERIYSDQELDGMALEEEAKRGMETTWNDKDLPF